MYSARWKKAKKEPLFDKPNVTVKKTPDLKAKLDKVFSLYIRLRDTMPNGYFRCISCGQIKPFRLADCGHYINRQHMATRFDEMNCNAQCNHCNRYMEGNIQAYRRGLIDKYGESKVILLEAKQYNTCKLASSDYENLIKHYKKLNKQLKKDKGL